MWACINAQVDKIFRIQHTDPWLLGDKHRTSRTIQVGAVGVPREWRAGLLPLLLVGAVRVLRGCRLGCRPRSLRLHACLLRGRTWLPAAYCCHSQAHTHTHARTHAHTRTHTRTHTYIHTRAPCPAQVMNNRSSGAMIHGSPEVPRYGLELNGGPA